MAGIAARGRRSGFTQPRAIIRRACSLLWAAKARVWPCLIGFAAAWTVMGLGPSLLRVDARLNDLRAALAGLGMALLAPAAVRALLRVKHVWRIDGVYLRSAAMFAVPLVGGAVATLIAQFFAGATQSFGASFAAMPFVLAGFAFALMPIGAAVGDPRFSIRLTLRLMWRAANGIYWALSGMMVGLLPLWLVMASLMRTPFSLAIGVGILMPAWMLAILSVLAAVYQLWDEGKTEAEAWGAAESPAVG